VPEQADDFPRGDREVDTSQGNDLPEPPLEPRDDDDRSVFSVCLLAADRAPPSASGANSAEFSSPAGVSATWSPISRPLAGLDGADWLLPKRSSCPRL